MAGGKSLSELRQNNMSSIAGRSPTRGRDGVKGYIQNLILEGDPDYRDPSGRQQDIFAFWFRPNPISETITPNYEDVAPMGMSHDYQTFVSTSSTVWTFEIYMNALMMLGATSQEQNIANRNYGDGQAYKEGKKTDLKKMSEEIEAGRRFLQALSVPAENIDGTIYQSPPPCLLVIPGIVSQRVRLRSLLFTYTNCDIDGNIKELRASVEFREAPLGRFTMQDVLDNGATRIWGL